ncbi:MAG: tetratricopeptide repeat protein [Brevinematia bacterium]
MLYIIVSEMNKISAYSLIKAGKITEALRFFEDTLRKGVDEESECGIKIVKYILSKIKRIREMGDPHKIGDMLIIEWKNLQQWINTNNCSRFSDLVESMKYYIFLLALKYYQSIVDNINANNSGNVIDIDLMVKVSKCYREIGEVVRCIDILEDVREYRPYDSGVLANLADAYFEIGEIDTSKLLFRESFFWNPQEVEIFEMKSMIIKGLIKIVVSNGYRAEEINEWIPIYGVIENLFDVRRELSQEEVNLILERVKTMEREYESNRRWRNILEPRLINSYIWLIDYYSLQIEDYALAKEVGKILQKFSPNIYNKLKLGVYKWL